jgi:hypothetical protein
MNERIRELAEQAGEYVNEVYTPPVRSKTPGKIWEDGHVDWHIQFNQKFAELIVRECATAITDDELAKDSGTFMMDSYAKGMRYSAHLIKEHFGVE